MTHYHGFVSRCRVLRPIEECHTLRGRQTSQSPSNHPLLESTIGDHCEHAVTTQ
ncbi:hypothetical protein RCH23_000162 [Cryobacterium sp. CAN_C3]|nr:hypothetical protein [Cryobacterium sp. CAN_C3]